MSERLPSGLLDTSVVIDLDLVDSDVLPLTVGVCAITMAELAAGPAATQDLAERARRQDRLQRAEAVAQFFAAHGVVAVVMPPVPTGGFTRRWSPRGASRAGGSRTC